MTLSYPMYEMAHLSLAPARAVSDATRLLFKSPFNPWSYTEFGRNAAASAELFERMTRRYGKPIFGFDSTQVEWPNGPDRRRGGLAEAVLPRPALRQAESRR